ncbi:hypothetical protein B0H13DRAFT_2306571 [Mycena leptocephala]|nr:hypothetical protein B0H13DRAFT_2306571 [Mycena leptocephala]
MVVTDRFKEMHESIHAGLANVEKWYKETDDTDDTDFYFICLALDSNFKTAYVQAVWDSSPYEETSFMRRF